MAESSTTESRQLIADLLASEEPAEVQDILVRIVESVIEPIAVRQVQARLRITVNQLNDSVLNQDALDIISEVKLTMMASIERMRRSGDPGLIGSLEGYTATVARNTCNEYLRRKFPSRFRLRNQLRYVFAKTDGLILSTTSGDGWICGRTKDLTGPDSVNPVPISLSGSMPILKEAVSLRTGGSPVNLHKLVAIVFDEIKRPVAFDELVTVLAELSGIKEPMSVEVTEQTKVVSRPDDAFREHDRKEFLEAVWRDVLDLPLRHRRALLLHMADDQNDNLLMMFPVAGVASLRMIADALEMDHAELARIWNRLPLQDSEISGLMGLERQQVINMRQSARTSLRRRLSKRGYFG